MAGVIKAPVSAGGLLVRQGGDGLYEVLLALEAGVWRIPKGMREGPEELPETAIREVLEETGILGSAMDLLHVGSWTYVYQGVECFETCTYYAMVPAVAAATVTDGEVQTTMWVALARAHAMVEFADERVAVGALEHRLRVLARPWEIVVVEGRSLGSRIGTGPLCLSRETAIASIDHGVPPVLVLRSFRPADAALIGLCAGVVSLTEGPASHVSVVAAAREVACVTAVNDIALGAHMLFSPAATVPEGAVVQLREQSASLTLAVPKAVGVAHVGRVPATASRTDAWAWARHVAEAEGLPEPTNWKLFKRDLLARWFNVPETTRFTSPWSVPEVFGRAQTLPQGTVRVSAFPREIACHATSFVLDRQDPNAFVAGLRDLPQASDLVIFVQEGIDNLCWRLVLDGDGFTIEAGIGQAMYIFEEERGQHPISHSSWTVGGHPSDVVSSGDARCDELLAEFLNRHAGNATRTLRRLAVRHELGVVAIEGYFRWRSGEYVACDLDLPLDWTFMA